MDDFDDPNNPVSIYLREVSRVQPLSEIEELALLNLWRSESRAAQQETYADRIVESHLADVVRIAEGHRTSGLPMLDLIQQGNLGLNNAMKELEKGDPTGLIRDFVNAQIDAAISAFVKERGNK